MSTPDKPRSDRPPTSPVSVSARPERPEPPEPAGNRLAERAAAAVAAPDDDDLVVVDDDENLPDKLYFRIGEVSQLVAVDTHVLRYWESEFRMKPHRSGSGQRLYRKQDLARFLRIKHLLHDEGYTIAGARKVLQGGAAGGPAIDPTMLEDALTRLADLRARIRQFRDELDET